MPTKEVTPQEISDSLDDLMAGISAGPVGSPEFRQAVHESQERRKADASPADPDGGKP